jgi:hypothetical protein
MPSGILRVRPNIFLAVHHKWAHGHAARFDVLTPPCPLSDIEVRHPALRGAKSPMQTVGTRPALSGSGGPLLAGMAAAVAGVGAVLAFADADSVLRGPFTLFFLLVAPGAAIGATLRGLEPFGRTVACVAGAVSVNLLVAQGMIATHSWSVPGGITAVTVISSLVLLPGPVRRLRDRTKRRRT